MVTFVFDSSAAVRYLDRKAGFDRVREVLKDRARENAKILISAVQWGEIAKIVGKRFGAAAVPKTLSRLAALDFETMLVCAQDAVRAAMIQNALRLSYADAFVIVLAQDHPSSILITADFDFKLADHLTSIEFLPPNP